MNISSPPNTTALDACVDCTHAHAELVMLGFDTLLRYGAAAPWKCIGPAEARSMQAHGLKLALIYEVSAKDVLLGAEEGAKAGAHALAFAPTVGLPPNNGSVVYPTADFDVTAAEIPTAIAYARAFVAACPGYGIGFYANGLLNDHLFAAGITKARWITQSMGFTGTRESLAANRYEIAQRLPARVAGLGVDPDSLREPGLDIGARVPFAVAAEPGLVAAQSRNLSRLWLEKHTR